jgi:hypothetical protein
MKLAPYLGLRDPERDSLEPNAEKDVGLYVDLDELVPRCLARLAGKAPKLVILGDYGTGKTHLLHVLKHEIDKDRFEPVYVKLDAFGKWAESRHLHDNLLTALGPDRLQVAIRGAGTTDDADLRQAVVLLKDDPNDPVARSWLLARKVTVAQAERARFSGPLHAYARGVKYAEIWRFLADGFRRASERELLFFIDESETFQQAVDQTRAADLGVAVREMFDTSNKSHGVVMGLTTPKGDPGRGFDQSTHPFSRSDVASRIMNIMFRLGRLDEEDRRRRFLTELLDRLLVNRQSFLSADALEALVVHGPDWARNAEVLNRVPVHREYVKLLDRIARVAHERGVQLPLTADYFRADFGAS